MEFLRGLVKFVARNLQILNFFDLDCPLTLPNVFNCQATLAPPGQPLTPTG